MRILFITSTRIGDAVLSTGIIDHLMRAHPDARFTIAVGRVAEGVFRRMPALDRLIPIEKKRFGLHWLGLWATKHVSPRAFYRLVQWGMFLTGVKLVWDALR